MIKTRLFLAVLLSSTTRAAIDSTAFDVLIKNVTVPKDSIALDSSVNGRNYFSGIVTYDLESDLDSVDVHVYLEEVPFKRYYVPGGITFSSDTGYHYGHALFINIDSLCKGNVRKTAPGNGRVIAWNYSTANMRNHCRMKVGVGNLQYVNTKADRGINQTPFFGGTITPYEEDIIVFNNLGLLARQEGHALDTGSFHNRTMVRRYSRCGQMVVDDTALHYDTRAYDAYGRLIVRDDVTSGIFNTFVYDSLSRAVQVRQHGSDATVANPGTPANTEFITYGLNGYIARTEKISGYLVTACDPVYHFQGTEVVTFYFSASVPGQLDSNCRDLFETARNNKLVSRYRNINRYSAAGELRERQFVHLQLDDPGTCWAAGGPLGYEEQKMVYLYDLFGYLYRFDSYARKSPENDFGDIRYSYCARREYDSNGNTIRQYDSCDTNEVLSLSAVYNRFNQIVTLERKSPTATTSGVYTCTWELIDLDEQEEALYENTND